MPIFLLFVNKQIFDVAAEQTQNLRNPILERLKTQLPDLPSLSMLPPPPVPIQSPTGDSLLGRSSQLLLPDISAQPQADGPAEFLLLSLPASPIFVTGNAQAQSPRTTRGTLDYCFQLFLPTKGPVPPARPNSDVA